jgi:uncharacterized protein
MPNPQIYKKLDQLLTDLDYDMLAMDVIHGFCSAVICSPSPIEPTEWIPQLIGIDNESLVFDSQQQAEKLINMLIDLYNDILNDITLNTYAIFVRNDDGKINPKPWCMGFIWGISLRNDDWDEGSDKTLLDYMIPIYYIADPDKFLINLGGDGPQQLSINENEMQERLYTVVPAIYNFWYGNTVFDDAEQQEMDLPDLMGEENQKSVLPENNWPTQIALNDPCPCGSGKKYKNCCGRGH